MNMHEFQRRFLSNGKGDPALTLVRKLRSVQIENARQVLTDVGAGWIVWNDAPGPMDPEPPVGLPSYA